MQGVFPHGISEISGVFCEYFGQIESFYNVNSLLMTNIANLRKIMPYEYSHFQWTHHEY